MTNTIWLDVTTLMKWHRPAVGIIRTELECAKYILEEIFSGKNFKFCVYDKQTNYYELSPFIVARHIENLKNLSFSGKNDEKVGAVQTSSPLANITTNIWYANNLKPIKKTRVFFERNERNLVEVYEQIISINDKLETIFASTTKFKKLIKYSQNVKNLNNFIKRKSPTLPEPAKNNSISKLITNAKASKFNTGDTYISLGLDWDDKDLTYLYELKKSKKLKVLLFCYDIIPVKYPQLCVGNVATIFAKYFVDVAWVADKVLCISKSSENDFVEMLHSLGAPVPLTNVVHLGCDITKPRTFYSDEKIQRLIEKPYILFVSSIERRKNHEVIYKAYTRLYDEGYIDVLPNVIFVGMHGWGVDDLMKDISLDPRVKEKFIILNHVDDNDLAHLYSNCQYTVFPSLYEGWGLPVAESLAFGKLAVISNNSSLPEVGREFAIYCDPLNPVEWSKTILELSLNIEKLNMLEKNIQQNYKSFAWNDTAKFVIESAKSIDMIKN